MPLSYDALEAAAPFTSEQCTEGKKGGERRLNSDVVGVVSNDYCDSPLLSSPRSSLSFSAFFSLPSLPLGWLWFCDDSAGIVAVAGDTLRIITLDRLSDAFNATITPLSYTGRRLAVNTNAGTICVIEVCRGVDWNRICSNGYQGDRVYHTE